MEVCNRHDIAFTANDCPACILEDERDKEVDNLNDMINDRDAEIDSLKADVEHLEDTLREADSNRT